MKSIFKTGIAMGCLSALALFSSNPAQAQEWNLQASGFVNHQDFREGLVSGGYAAGLGYSQYLSQRWSVTLEVRFSQSRLNYIGHPRGGSFKATDLDGESFEFYYTSNFYRETNTWNSLRVPLTVQYETKGKTRWYIRTGVLANVVLGEGKSQTLLGYLKTSGYYPQWDAELTGPEFAGFGNFGYQKREREIKFENTYAWVLETGAKWMINHKQTQSIYLGAFLNIGLNSMRPLDADYGRLMEFTNDIHQPIDYRNIWNQEGLKDKKLQDYVFGIRIRYGFGGKKL